MRCGKPSNGTSRRTFSWCPAYYLIPLLAIGIGIIFYYLIKQVVCKTMVVEVPLCRRHRYDQLKYTILMLMTVLADLTMLFVVVMYAHQFDPRIATILNLAMILMILASIPYLITISLTQIRARYIDDITIEISGVHTHFKEVVESQQDAAHEHRENRRRRQRPSLVKPVMLALPAAKSCSEDRPTLTTE